MSRLEMIRQDVSVIGHGEDGSGRVAGDVCVVQVCWQGAIGCTVESIVRVEILQL